MRSIAPDGRAMVLVSAHPDMAFPKPGTHCLVKLRRPRNIKHNSLYWTLLKKVVLATGRWTTEEALHRWLKIKLGMYEIVGTADGKTLVTFDSTDFVSMAQDEFKAYFDYAIEVICVETGIDPETLTREAHDG